MNGVCDGPYDDLAGLYAEQTHVTHPFHPLNPPPLRSRGELHDHFTAPPPNDRTLNRKPVDITIHDTADPEVIVAEFAYRGLVDKTGETFSVPCIFVMRSRDGLIIESRDYIDPIASARAWGQLDSLMALLRPAPNDSGGTTSSGGAAADDLAVEVPGIEPGSCVALPGLLRAQLAMPLLGPSDHASESV